MSFTTTLMLYALAIQAAGATPLHMTERVQSIVARQDPADGSFTCDGRYLPEYDDCRILLDTVIFPRGNEEFCLPPMGGGANCRTWQEGNCYMSSCNFGTAEFCPLYSVEGTRLDIIMQGCERLESGGRALSAQNILVEIRDNPEFEPNPAMAREFSTTANPSNGSDGQVVRRQQEGDTAFRVFARGEAVQQPGVFRPVTERLPAGTEVTDVEEMQETVGWGTEISASSSFLDLVEVSVGFSFDFSTTVTNSRAVAFAVACDPGQQGIIDWYPLFNFYQGVFEPSGDELTIWEPVDTSGSQGNYVLRCLG